MTEHMPFKDHAFFSIEWISIGMTKYEYVYHQVARLKESLKYPKYLTEIH